MKIRALLWGFGFYTVCWTSAATSQTATLENCQYWQERINYYTKLRRSGGTAIQMERWKQRRSDFENLYRTNRCHKFGKDLRLTLL